MDMAVSRRSLEVETDPIRILLVDRSKLVRSAIERVLCDAGFVVVAGDANSCNAAIRLARKQQPQVILVNLPDSSVELLDGARKIHRQFPQVQILVLTELNDSVIQERLLHVGVAGCISSGCDAEELFTAINTVLQGRRYLSGSLAQKLAERRLAGNEARFFDKLTHRELQILLLVAEGRNTSSIARELCLTQKTVNGYRNRLLEKLQVRTEVELMHVALLHGLVRIPQID